MVLFLVWRQEQLSAPVAGRAACPSKFEPACAGQALNAHFLNCLVVQEAPRSRNAGPEEKPVISLGRLLRVSHHCCTISGDT